MNNTSWIANPWLTLLCRLALGGFFIFAALGKIGNAAVFAAEIRRYEFLPDLANLMAITFPWIELVLGVCIVVGFWPRAASLGASFMLIVFMIAIVWALSLGLKIECGCVGGSEPLTIWTLLRDVLLLLFGSQILFSSSRKLGVVPD